MDKNIVILGGGFGGLQSALTLSKKLSKIDTKNNYNIILVDRYDYHTFTPLLYEIATTSQNTAEYEDLKSLVTYKFEELLSDKVRVIKDEVTGINLNKNIVDLNGSKLGFDYLVLALGSEINDFNVPGVKEHALKLKSFDDAVAIRNKLVYEVENKEKGEGVDVVIGGGGSTGVELAGEIKSWSSGIEERKSCGVNVSLVQGDPNLLPGFSDEIINKAEKRLKKLGVNVITDTLVKEVKKDKVLINGESLSYDVFIWAGGIKASPLAKDMPAEKGDRGRIHVVNKLECIPNNPELKVYKDVYAIGDISCIEDPNSEKKAPAVARVAIVQGRIAAFNIINKIRERESLSEIREKSFTYKEYPYVIPVGGKYALARVGPFVFSGILAWIFKGMVELNYFISIMPVFDAIKVWFKGLKVFIKNDRLG